MTRQHLLIALILLLSMGGLAYWFFENFELREEEIPTGYKGEARTNPFYAARLLLRAMGIDAQRIDMPELNRALPPATANLIITTRRSTLNTEKSQRLLDWVKNGGHLLVRSLEPEYYDPEEDEQPPPPKDPLLEALGITPVYNHDTEWDGDIDAYEFPGNDGEIKNLFVDFDDEYHLGGGKKNDILISSFNGTHAIHRKLGKGAVTVMVDMNFIRNFSIGDEDHAETFWEMVHWHNADAEEVFILHNDDMPALQKLLWQYSKPVVISLGLLLFFWLAKGFFRFGPLIPQPEARRRSLMEHIEASGQFFWKDNQQQRLIKQTRHALQKRLAHLHPGWADLNDQERESHLSELIQMPVESVHQLLHGNGSYQSQDFTRMIQQLENIRKQL